jgi:putative Holliday junction resolvase
MDLKASQVNNYKIAMAFDFGLKRIGLAVGQTLTKTAQPVHIFKADDGVPNWDTVSKYVNQWAPDVLVVGLPLNMDGTESEMSLLAKNFADKLRKRFVLPVKTFDERLSTFDAKGEAAEEYAKPDMYVDAIAAKLILESWFNSND